jgi:hypothetical protein
MKTIAVAALLLLAGCSSNPKYEAFRDPPYIDIEIEGRREPLRVSDKNEIRSITRTIDMSFIDDDRYRVRTPNRDTDLWIWTTYPFPNAKGGSYPVSVYLQRDGRVCFVASMIRYYEILNSSYRDAVLAVARHHLAGEKETLKLIQNEK